MGQDLPTVSFHMGMEGGKKLLLTFAGGTKC